MSEATGFVKGKRLGTAIDGMVDEEEEEEQLEIELTGIFPLRILIFIEDEFNYAVKMTEHSLRRLTKAHIIELRS